MPAAEAGGTFLALGFCLGAGRYFLEVARIIEVVPWVELRKIPLTAACVAGLLNYRGTVAPVIDLAELLEQRPAADRLSSRIILVKYPGKDGSSHVLGLLAEKVLEVKKISTTALTEPGLAVEAAPYLGKVDLETGGLDQLIELEKLLPESLQAQLFAAVQT